MSQCSSELGWCVNGNILLQEYNNGGVIVFYEDAGCILTQVISLRISISRMNAGCFLLQRCMDTGH